MIRVIPTTAQLSQTLQGPTIRNTMAASTEDKLRANAKIIWADLDDYCFDLEIIEDRFLHYSYAVHRDYGDRPSMPLVVAKSRLSKADALTDLETMLEQMAQLRGGEHPATRHERHSKLLDQEIDM